MKIARVLLIVVIVAICIMSMAGCWVINGGGSGTTTKTTDAPIAEEATQAIEATLQSAHEAWCIQMPQDPSCKGK